MLAESREDAGFLFKLPLIWPIWSNVARARKQRLTAFVFRPIIQWAGCGLSRMTSGARHFLPRTPGAV